MARTFDVKRFFFTTQKYPSKYGYPLVERGVTREVSFPYREGSSIVLRVPFTDRGLVFGVWKDKDIHSALIDDEDALAKIDDLLQVRQLNLGANEISDWRKPTNSGQHIDEYRRPTTGTTESVRVWL